MITCKNEPISLKMSVIRQREAQGRRLILYLVTVTVAQVSKITMSYIVE